MINWTKFQFFDKSTVDDEKIKQFFEEHDITCCTSGRRQIMFGDNKGTVHVMESSLETRKCLAHEQRVNHIQHVPSKNLLVTVGDDGGEAFLDTLKIFNLNQYDPKSGSFILVKSELLFPKVQKNIAAGFGKALHLIGAGGNEVNLQPSPVTCLQVNRNFSAIALGLGDGHIILYMGENMERPNSKVIKRVLNGVGEDHGHITGLKWGRCTNSSNPNGTNTDVENDEWEILYVTTVDRVFSYRVGKKGHVDPLVELDDSSGCENGCCALSNEGDFVTATKNGIWFYKPEGKGSCFAFEGKKIMVDWFRTYLVVVSCDLNRTNNIQQTVNIYDLKNKLIAFKFSSEKLQVSHILQEWGKLFILSSETGSDGTLKQVMHQLEEKDIQTELEMLCQKNLYTTAINLANNQQLDPNYVVEIYRIHGDHLYHKKDYDGAMTQYLKTIGKLEPSYIIRLFLDAQRITNLTTYLEELHAKNLATSDHTTLLLNCYTKLKDAKKGKLDTFIRDHSNWHYDVETAIRVCRSSGYKEHALLLAQEHGEHDWFLKITIEDFPEDSIGTNYRRALRHIESLPFELAEKYMQIYGKILVTKLPKSSTNVLIRLCTDYFPVSQHVLNRTIYPSVSQTRTELLKAEKKVVTAQNTPTANGAIQSHKLSSLDFLRFRTTGTTVGVPTDTNTDSIDTSSLTLSGTIDTNVASNRSPAENFIHAFSSQPYWLMLFLENVISRNAIGGSNPVSPTVYNTLIELYLQYLDKDVENHKLLNDVQPTSNDSSKELEYIYDIMPPNELYKSLSYKQRCLEILENPESNYDTEHILVLVQTKNFKEGVLKMYERLGLHYDIIQYYMDQKDYENVINCCMKYGHLDSNLWVQVLNYFSKNDHDDSYVDSNEYISRILQKIEKDNLLPPLLVVQILAKNGSKTQLHTLQEFLCTRIAQEQMLMKEDESKIKEYQADTRAMKKEVFLLRTSAKIFQSTTCSYCGQQLDLPAVHFMCGHSYHQRCCTSNLGEDEQERCPSCHKKNTEILQRKQKMEESSDQHETFFKQLNKNSDGFSVVSEYLGRNMFSALKIEDLHEPMTEEDLYIDEDESDISLADESSI
jgi:tetratricopeptide (TPR) repeat protein